MSRHQLGDILANAYLPPSGKALNVPSVDGCLLAWGTTVPSGDAGYAPGCMFIHTDGASDEALFYVNTGTAASCTFTANDFGLETELAAVTATSGASKIGVYDTAGNFTGTTVEAVLAEIMSTLASVANGKGASLIGVEDAGGKYDGADVEAILLEIDGRLATLESA